VILGVDQLLARPLNACAMVKCIAGIFAIFIVGLIATPAYALSPDELALVVNNRVPAGKRLAEYYAQVRGVPAGRIIEIDVGGSEQIEMQQYDAEVVPAIRSFLRENGLESKVKCLVTFWGVPIRIGPKRRLPGEAQELAKLEKVHDETMARVAQAVKSIEATATKLDARFEAGAGGSVDALARRAEVASRSITDALRGAKQSPERERAASDLLAALRELGGPMAMIDRLDAGLLRAGADGAANLEALRGQLEQARSRVVKLRERLFDPASRAEIRQVVGVSMGAFHLAQVQQVQIEYLSGGPQTMAAFDSELALLWWNYYPREKWMINPMHHAVREAGAAPVLMTMRLDGPQEGSARDIIIASLKAEREGLTGRVVLDSRSIMAMKPDGKPDGYGQYDESIRNLATLLAEKTKLQVLHDTKPAVLSEKQFQEGVMLYCGWYSLRNYVPSMAFKPGAVGYHVASLEMISLRSPNEKGWVPNLLSDGIASTMGAVGEPYLHSFPRADEFFPLLLTGEPTLAEVFWQTNLLTSWMITVIGDPLYRPFKLNPAMRREDLPWAKVSEN